MESKSMIKENLENNKPKVLGVFRTISPKYQELLIKFCKNNELTELIKECILDLEKAEEVFYMENKKYPEQRNSLMKLMYDLEQTEVILNQQALLQNKKEE